ncbi:MAG: Wzz/FepE/Etk N-terminal domain-containing protein, partial [Mariniphaga sp.]
MTQPEINSNNRNVLQSQDDDSIDLRKLTFKFLRNWYWFVLAVVVTVGLAFLYNRYKTPVYEVNASMLVEEGKTTSPLSGAIGGP